MKPMITSSLILSGALLSGCCSTCNVDGPKGPGLVASGYSTEAGGHYAEVGVQFSTAGDFVALFAPTRWKNPVKTGGSLSWLNPVAWSDDAGRTGRILLGEAAVVGGVAVAVVAGNDDSGDSVPASAGGSSGGSDSGGSGSGPVGPGNPGGPPATPF